MKRILLVAILFSIAGCATLPPVMHSVQSTATFDANSGDVFDSVNEYFDKEKIPVKKKSGDSSLLETEEIRVPYEGFDYLSDYCDCGAPGGFYVYHEILGIITTFIQEADEGKTSMHIVASYRASLWLNDTFIGWVVCQSKGHIESRLIKHVNTDLKKRKKLI